MDSLLIVRRLIDNTNVSQLARDVDISRQQLARIVEGKTPNPGFVTIEQILNVLGYDLKVVRKEPNVTGA